jgi:putative endopeptidase
MSLRSMTLAVLLAAFAVWPVAAHAQSGSETCMGLISPSPSGSSAGKKSDSTLGTGTHGLNLANFDRSVSPCKDFYDFASGGWIKTHQIPAAYPSWGNFNELAEHNQKVLRQILEREAANRAKAKPGSNDWKLGNFYASCMNTSAIDAAGTKPLEPELRRIAAIHSLAGLEAEVARLQNMGAGVLFSLRSTQDRKNSTQEIADAYQGGLGLPDRDDYLKEDAHAKQLREKYVAHITKMFELLGDPAARAAAEAKTVMTIETQLAEASMTRVERRDPDKTYHKMDAAQFQKLTPHFSWKRYFTDLGFPGIDTINVSQPKFFQALDKELSAQPLSAWKTYLRWHLAHEMAPDLSTAFVDANFDFYGRTLTGAKELQPRWQRCVRSTDRHLGEMLGQKYVAAAFPPEAKAAALKMVHNLIAALHADLETLPWMDAQTRAAAIRKLDKIMIKVGYPDHWESYAAYHVVAGPYVDNIVRGNQFASHRNLARIGKPVDRTLWGMTPPTVNAYYNPTMNEIVFPAGILQPPFFDPKADDALNYGGIGAVIGHEMTHGFDDEGSKFDADGNLKNWWTPQDLANFHQRAECVANQFNTYVAIDNLHENGHLVLGESIADLGGLTIAYKAFEKTPEFRSHEKIQGFTPQQRFFLAFARIWTGKQRPQYIRLMVKINPHPLGRYRTIGPLSNMDQFAKAFHCHGSDSMVRPPADRCKIW